jgi:hypothetical protein
MKCDYQAWSWPTPLQALALVVSPRLGLRQSVNYLHFLFHYMNKTLDVMYILNKSIERIELHEKINYEFSVVKVITIV